MFLKNIYSDFMKAFIFYVFRLDLYQKDLRVEIILAGSAELKRHCMWSVIPENMGNTATETLIIKTRMYIMVALQVLNFSTGMY